MPTSWIERHEKALSFVLVAISLLLAVALVEGVLQVVSDDKPNIQTEIKYAPKKGYYTYLPETEFTTENEKGEKIQIKTDRKGLRNDKGIFEDSKVFVCGDSFISAVNTPLNETLTAKLQQKGIKAYNCGMDGYSTFSAVKLIDELTQEHVPETVVLAFYLGNDFHDNSLESTAKPEEGPKKDNFFERFINKSKVYNLVRVNGSRLLHLIRPKFSGAHSYVADEIALLLQNPDADAKEMLSKTKAAFGELKRLADANGFKVVIMGLPSKAQVHRSFKEMSAFENDPAAKQLALDAIKAGFSFDQPDSYAKQLSDEFGFRYVSLLSAFRAKKENVFYLIDAHWTPEGQELTAQTMADVLKRNYR